MPTSGWGLIPWGTGIWGLPVFTPTPIPPSPSSVNIINVIPAPGSFNIARNQTFTFTIKTQFFPLNPNNTYIFLDNQAVVQGTIVSPNFTVSAVLNIDGISVDYTIMPNYLFKDADVFTLQIYATDIHGAPSFPFWAGYLVVDTRPSLITPIYPLDGYVDVPIDLSLHFLINQLAAPDAGIDRSTLNIYVNDQHAVIDSVIQDSFLGVYSTINFPAFTDITSPFEVVLDSTDRYEAGEIVTVKATAVSSVVPVIDTGAAFLNQYGQIATDAYGSALPFFTIAATQKLSNKIYQLTLDFGVAPPLFGEGPFGLTSFGAGYQNLVVEGFIQDGYKVKNSNGNIFSIIEIIDNTRLLVEIVPKTLRGSYSFVTLLSDIGLATPVFAGYFQGVYLVDNLGDGYHVNVTWHPARTTRPDYDLAYLIYYSTTRSDVFYEEPKLITQGRKLPPPETVKGADAQLFGYFAEIPLPVGVSYYFGVRATEFPHSSIPVVPADGYGSFAAGRVVVGGYSFAIPPPQILTSQVVGLGSIVLPVPSRAGYATNGGYITVGPEIMRYTSLHMSPPGFVVASTGRGQFGTTIQNIHNMGETVRMYSGNKDDNTVIAKNLVSWDSPNDPHRTRPDLITTDFTLEDGYHTAFEYFDYCGYHRYRPDELLSDTDNCGTYVGGEYNGHRGMSAYDRMLATEEQLLEVTGEPSILLKRVWSGERCICMTSRKDSSRVRSCALCFGTGYKGGYIQYRNPRRNDQRIMVHFNVADEEISMKAQAGWDQTFAPGTWTLAVPSIKDRDVLIRFNEFGQMDWIYEISTVSRAKNMLINSGRQKLKLNRLDKTDVLYQFKIIK